MDFDWDDGNVRHLNERHNITAEEAVEAFYSQFVLVAFQDREGEFRRFALGQTLAGKVLVFIYILRRQKVRIITAFPAKKRLQRLYQERMDPHG